MRPTDWSAGFIFLGCNGMESDHIVGWEDMIMVVGTIITVLAQQRIRMKEKEGSCACEGWNKFRLKIRNKC